MSEAFPDYCLSFACIAGNCKHSCCIGWEIDIDEDTADYYASLPAPLDEKICAQIETSPTPHFRMKENGRCPFLNDDSLCDIILSLGEGGLCEICDLHPRYFGEFCGQEEMGLGLCCEAAGALILGQKTPFLLIDRQPSSDQRFLLRKELIGLLEENQPYVNRLEKMMQRVGLPMPSLEKEGVEMLLSLERLDETWGEKLKSLPASEMALQIFDKEMRGREKELANFSLSLLYRHFTAMADDHTPEEIVSFVVFCSLLLRQLGAVQLAETGAFSFENLVEAARLFSSEIEYSDENPEAILGFLANP